MKQKPSGFTLIELLVVIAIIAILAAILFPVFAQAKLAAKKAVGISNVKQVTLAGVLYSGDNDDTSVPLYYFNPADLHLPSTFGFYYWPVLELPYTKSEQIFLDPQDTSDDPQFSDGTHGRFDPNNMFHYYIVGAAPSYGYNYHYLNTKVMDNPPGADGLPYHYIGLSLTSLGTAAQTVQFAESTCKDLPRPDGSLITNPVGYSRIEPPSVWDLTKVFPNAVGQGQLWGRYNPKSVIVGWLDGHAKYVPINSLVGTGTTSQQVDRYWNGMADQN